MEAHTQSSDVDVGPAVAKLRFFRFAEYVLIFLGVTSVSWLISFAVTLGLLDQIEPGLGAGFSEEALTLGIILFGAIIVIGALAYAASGRLQAPILKRQALLLPIGSAALFGAGVIFLMQFSGIQDKIFRFGLTSGMSALQTLDPTFAYQPPEVQAEIQQQIQTDIAQHQEAIGQLNSTSLSFMNQFEVATGAAIACLVGLWSLRRFMRVRLSGQTTLMTYLQAIEKARRREKPPKSGKRINGKLGFLFLAGAAVATLAQGFLQSGNIFIGIAIGVAVSLLATVALFQAKRYLQISADSLLASDKRKPILFLRSFSDDPKFSPFEGITHWGFLQLIDFSAETRLANHFMRFGPFIAVGSPMDKVAQFGAARVRLSDDQWQQIVMTWMESSSVIVMFVGTTEWIGWELKRIIEGGWAEKLILLFPPLQPVTGLWYRRWLKKQKPDISKRFEHAKSCFADTPWEEAWRNIAQPDTVLCASLDASGELQVIRSERRSKDAYELCAKMAHLRLLNRQEGLIAAVS